jgi:hypothetical protein
MKRTQTADSTEGPVTPSRAQPGQFEERKTNKVATVLNRQVERAVNQLVRRRDAILKWTRLGGRKAAYDDHAFEFTGGPADALRRKHYDKSLRMLWKAEDYAPWLSFKDCTKVERQLHTMALDAMTDEERAEHERLSLPEYKALLDQHYTQREKEAIVGVLAAIGHGEAYAWLVSAELLAMVESTGGRTALTMQVLEEAKHFVVLRELLQAFDVPIRRQSAWEYLLLENVYKAKGLEKFFGMNILVEGIALSLFGLLSTSPGLEVLRRFHLDESRHTALPTNYLREFPLSRWEKLNPRARLRRFKLVLPALALIPHLEEDLAVLGVDAFEFGGSVLRKLVMLSERNGFLLPIPSSVLLPMLNTLFNRYCQLTRPQHVYRDFMTSETTRGASERKVEAEVFGDTPSGSR